MTKGRFQSSTSGLCWSGLASIRSSGASVPRASLQLRALADGCEQRTTSSASAPPSKASASECTCKQHPWLTHQLARVKGSQEFGHSIQSHERKRLASYTGEDSPSLRGGIRLLTGPGGELCPFTPSLENSRYRNISSHLGWTTPLHQVPAHLDHLGRSCNLEHVPRALPFRLSMKKR